jgi:alpha-2-macroglobulin
MGTFQLNVAREYFKLAAATQDNRIVYRLEKLNGPVQPGDVLAVHVTVSGSDWRYLLIEDPFLAGAEAIERDDLYEIAADARPQWWRSGGWAQREFHDDHAAFFIDRFKSGQREYRYLLKVVNPGKFRVSPTRVEPMYQPQYVATSDGQIVEVNSPSTAGVSPGVAGTSSPGQAQEVK